MVVENALFPTRLTLSMEWFSRYNFHFFCFFGIWAEKIWQVCQNNSLRWQSNNSRKWSFTWTGLIFDIVFSLWRKLFGFGPNFSTRMSILNSPRPDEQLPEKHLFLEWNISFRLFWLLEEENFGQSAKKIRTVQTGFEVSGGKNGGKSVFFWNSLKFTHLFGLWWKHNRKFSILPHTGPKERLQRSDFLSSPSIQIFF